MNILLGITGSVATVLTPKLVSKLLKSGHNVEIIATERSLYFLPEMPENQIPISSSKKVRVHTDKEEWPIGGYHKNDPVQHIEIREWANLFLIAPLTANTLAKIANGMADNFLSCTTRAWQKKKPLILVPAMNTEMWIDPITKEQLNSLKKRYKSFHVIQPVSKKLACGDTGLGAMANLDDIINTIKEIDQYP